MYYPSLTLSLDSLVKFASQHIGITEEGKDNYGEWVQKFQKAVDGKAQGEPWCVCFVQYCLKEESKRQGRDCLLFKTESALELWHKSPKICRIEDPIVGAVMVWQKYDDKGNPTSAGHVGIVTEVVSAIAVKTVEGNTSSGSGIVREGDGVYEKTRSKTGSSTMRVVGWLIPWA